MNTCQPECRVSCMSVNRPTSGADGIVTSSCRAHTNFVVVPVERRSDRRRIPLIMVVRTISPRGAPSILIFLTSSLSTLHTPHIPHSATLHSLELLQRPALCHISPSSPFNSMQLFAPPAPPGAPATVVPPNTAAPWRRTWAWQLACRRHWDWMCWCMARPSAATWSSSSSRSSR